MHPHPHIHRVYNKFSSKSYNMIQSFIEQKLFFHKKNNELTEEKIKSDDSF